MKKKETKRVAICRHCGTAFNCITCKEAEEHKYEYWGKRGVRK